MKLVIVQYPDSVNISTMIKGSVVSVSSETVTLANGTVMSLADVLDVTSTLVPHTHGATIGAPIP